MLFILTSALVSCAFAAAPPSGAVEQHPKSLMELSDQIKKCNTLQEVIDLTRREPGDYRTNKNTMWGPIGLTILPTHKWIDDSAIVWVDARGPGKIRQIMIERVYPLPSVKK